MSYEWLIDLPRFLDKWQVRWVGYGDWETHAGAGPDERDYTPSAILNHHTASTDWYPVDRLTNKCNMYIDPSGLVWLYSLGYQFDSGYGDPNVLGRARNDVEPRPPEDMVPSDRINGNPWFVDVEVGHWGYGEPIPPAQREALLAVNAAVCDMQGWNPETRVLGHKEWTRRKVDPRWSWHGEPDSMEDIRRDTVVLMEEHLMPRILWEQLIDALFEGRPDEFQGDSGYWKTLDPASDEWTDFFNAFVRAISLEEAGV